ncbi:OmpA family protein [Arenimonas oryziterrae]|uniref:OmpA-like domain-containing protein n=1 Tax=Arenimonas oryziterrae DSM 21050 = YC6267 TaxID=1121015 RepID=A0A091BDY9_9GAMM|nr:OmpA family protein [Arenimonas oryziterrae]KFN42625.1 hypothetical protein N789_13370 [Arenimonas oryziterrae DSM 21050 = YC6267]
MNLRPATLSLTLCLALATLPVLAQDANADAARLAADIAALDQDPSLGDLAGLERLKARQAIAVLQAARSRDREHALFLAERWVQAAQAAAQAESLQRQSVQLDRERDQIMVEASRRDAELARHEADRLRLQSLAREEEAERLAETNEAERLAGVASTEAANAQAAQARKLADARARETALARKEAELAAAVAADSMSTPATGSNKPATASATASNPPPRTSATASATTASAPPIPTGRPFFTLAGTAFATGRATLTPAGQLSVQRIAAKFAPRGAIYIEGHTDSQGSDAANLSLSRQRAEAVRQALISHGVAGSRIRATGRGETIPVADNGSEPGRARNRRVEIFVE